MCLRTLRNFSEKLFCRTPPCHCLQKQPPFVFCTYFGVYVGVPVPLLTRDSNTGVFLWILQNFKEHRFWRTYVNGCFWKSVTTVTIGKLTRWGNFLGLNEQMMRPVMATVTCIFYATNDVKDDKRLYTDGKMNLMTVSIMCYVIQNCT